MPTINTLRDLALAAKRRRLDLHLSQAEVAHRAEVSRQWVNAFERGKGTSELQLVLRLLSALDLRLSVDVHGENQEVDRTTSRRVDLDAVLDDLRRHE
ncbi:helix-turn-helix transcriptional regulator [Solirubrobacter pauli]|uniref:helix-turn-helix transcriptional regulator n=1 Tax=Solirubrobacter pauli TaxID=166793 RepID=UPI001476EFC7|nr:helix-turn-helix transcriptional regulator [Solirubrobacter pauli]